MTYLIKGFRILEMEWSIVLVNDHQIFFDESCKLYLQDKEASLGEIIEWYIKSKSSIVKIIDKGGELYFYEVK